MVSSSLFNLDWTELCKLKRHLKYATIDGNLNIGFESYISKIFNTLNEEGILLFESHNINGDDKDMDVKFEIASKYFTLVKYKMVKAFFPQDIDKLFLLDWY